VYINFILCANLLPVATHAGHEELAMVEVRYTAMLTRVLRVLIIALLCVGVFLQILGAAVAFWDVDGSDDPFMSSILTSFAVLGNESVLLVILQSMLCVAMISVSYQQLRQDTLFHPPLS
jgi:zinc transporter ZupT